jgi:hypothetical protein
MHTNAGSVDQERQGRFPVSLGVAKDYDAPPLDLGNPDTDFFDVGKRHESVSILQQPVDLGAFFRRQALGNHAVEELGG